MRCHTGSCALAPQTELLMGSMRVTQAAVRRLAAALARRDDGADALRAVDLDQLQIENEQLLARVEQRNSELLKLKISTGRSVQACLQTCGCNVGEIGWAPDPAYPMVQAPCYGMLADVCTALLLPLGTHASPLLAVSRGKSTDVCTAAGAGKPGGRAAWADHAHAAPGNVPLDQATRSSSAVGCEPHKSRALQPLDKAHAAGAGEPDGRAARADRACGAPGSGPGGPARCARPDGSGPHSCRGMHFFRKLLRAAPHA